MKRLYLKQRLLSLVLVFWARRVQANVSFQLAPDLKIHKGDTLWIFHNQVAWYKGRPLTGDWMSRVLVSVTSGWLSQKPKRLVAPLSIYTDPKSDHYYPLVFVNSPGPMDTKPARMREERQAPEMDPEIQGWFSHHTHGDRE